MKKNLFLLLTTLISFTLLESCTLYRAVHYESVDIGFFKNKNEGNATFEYDGNNRTGKLGGNISYAVGNNFFVGIGGGIHNHELQKVLAPLSEYNFDENDFTLSGYNGKGFVGYFNNFGRGLNSYFETVLTLNASSETLKINDLNPNITTKTVFNYKPIGFGLQIGIGINTDKVGFLGGVKLNSYSFNTSLPLTYHSSILEYRSTKSLTQIFAGVRFGSGPVKGNIQLSVGHNLYPWYIDDFNEIVPVFGFGVTYNWGRKKTKIINL
ncbi:MAG TPA: hypothetical protein PLC76_09835 [Saprospiraceae bacterium]|jgi:hypothetical protein|nr:hypothetical protein [Candidatus Parvibacillus calidus]MBX2937180.1 hypothetical protein [Saprospiraceae bacterium]MBX7178769.1 hypothetical protein [Saprospiraceae bacterium]MCB0589736.1 hypothetical protein [Saprospiraceae bacterium]MCC7149208.1 hypothetical protein [Saprospiraceae bacterium]